MKKKDVVIGQVYRAIVSGNLCRVQLRAVSPYGGWIAQNLDTDRTIRIRSAQRLRQVEVVEGVTKMVPEDDSRKPAGITIGMKVRYIRKNSATGTHIMGDGQPTAWLCVGAVGVVVELHKGYAGHACPNHNLDPDCICGGEGVAIESGRVQEMEPWGTVEYETDVPGRLIKRAITPSDEGKTWEPVI